MPWSNQGGGPWGSGGSKGPWGSGPQSSGPTPPDLEDLLRRSQDRLKGILPGGNLGGRRGVLIALAAGGGGGVSRFFPGAPGEPRGVLRLGEKIRPAKPRPDYHPPYPVQSALTPQGT